MLLFDQNLSNRLPHRLRDLFPGSVHVRAVALDRADDEEIWRHAQRHGLAIVTQDSDFADRSRLRGAPPKVVWLRCGNSTPRHIELLLRKHALIITELLQDSALHYVELF
jgi:predicted nuclease of predicted toxin-antitoxin system